MGTSRSHHDVAVVGARVAGASVALLLARMGHDVVVLERSQFPSDTLSTHGIARSGVVQLARWGLLDRVLESGAPAIRTVTFHVDGEATERRVKDRAGVDHLIAPRRHLLDPIIAAAAVDAGADVRFGTTVTGVRRDGRGRVTGVCARDARGETLEIDARVVIGADGLRSRVARSVGAPFLESRPATGAAHYAYYGDTEWNGIEFFVGEGLGGIFPTHGGEACVWVCSPVDVALAARRGTDSLDAALDRLVARAAPGLADRLAGATRTSAAQGVVGMANQVRGAHGPGWALVGDAAYHRDAVTGHGMSDAFRDAELLAEALDPALRGDADVDAALAAYDDRRRAALHDIFDITCALAAYPPPVEFVAQQRLLSAAIEAEATWLAARPVPGARTLAGV
ncbi:MAG TPA: NAD(P)/FAD-dependent oxidoreductase [Acidimicrobiales bacterium]